MIAIISDIHDNLPNLNTALTLAKENNVSALFVLGDVTNADTLKYLATNFSSTIYLVTGNMEVCDLETESKKYSQINFLGRQGGIIKIGNKIIGLCHEPFLADAFLKNCHSRVGGNPDLCPEIIFYGHTHKPWSSFAPFFAEATEGKKATEDKARNKIQLINPGNISNTLYPASFALWNEITNELELKIL